ncbi:MAG: hypothetical protein GY953_22630 [bacterium]|nr:hypothetical protein [bacterium]
MPFVHKVEDVDLPVRRVREAELPVAQREYDRWMKAPDTDKRRHRLLQRHREVIERHRRQETEPFYRVELHAIRLGDISIVTNPFELFLDFGVQIKARSVAEQTFIAQLAGDYGGYLPTARAVEAGGYGAEITSNYVGPEGGEVLVNRSVELINEMWRGAEPRSAKNLVVGGLLPAPAPALALPKEGCCQQRSSTKWKKPPGTHSWPGW